MAVYMDWPNRIIHVPRADLDLVQSNPIEIRDMDLNWFRMQLKGLEDDPAGMMFPDTHRHNTEVTLGSLTFARVIEIINNYTVTFEDGQYAVNLVGANSNVSDRVNVNQVSVRSANSAGMTSSPAIEYASFNGGVTIDTTSSIYGTIYPAGTQQRPVNNLSDALMIAEYRGFDNIFILSDLTIQSGQDVSSFIIKSDTWKVITIEPGAITDDTEFEKVSIYGKMSGTWNVLNDCWIYTITNFLGWIRGGSYEYIELAPYVTSNPTSYFDDILPMYANTPCVLVMNDAVKVTITHSAEIHEIRNMSIGTVLTAGLNSGKIILDNSCTGGEVFVMGIGSYENNSVLVVNDDDLVNSDIVADGVWEHASAVNLLSDVDTLKSIETGKWTIVNNQMIFYKPDNVTEVARFNLFNASGVPTMTEVTTRVKV